MATPVRRLRRSLSVALATLVVLAGSTFVWFSMQPASQAADLRQFNPGNIISDQVFFNPHTMSEAEIQTFLNQKGLGCSGSMCLKNYVDTMPVKHGDQFCTGYPASGGESAARLIYRVSHSCGINPQVILVMLQKEQSLVTRTSATSSIYQKAMGFGCPDTAACDSAYYGFANQIYSAARQFKNYAFSGRYTWVVVGQVNQIRYHPNAACGTGPVYIQNRATAGLYYYTPYQPNQAALNANYGTGDACSAYGNRNFYHYFTDWFGSAQQSASLVQAPGDGRVWLVSGTSRHHVSDYADYLVLSARLGGVATVSTSYINGLTTGRAATRYVHDPRTGTLYLLQADGTKHRFPTAEQVAKYGYAFDTYINLTAGQADAYATGPEVGDFFRVENGGEVNLIAGTTRRYVTTPGALSTAAAGRNSYIASMSASGAQKLTVGPSVLQANTLVRETSSGHVYLTLGDSGLLHIPSFPLAAEFGATKYDVFPDGLLTRNTIAPGTLSPFVKCGAEVLVAASGVVIPVSGTSYAGFTPTAVPAAGCAAFPRSSSSSSAPFFVQIPGRGEVYLLEAGQLHHVRTPARLSQLNGSRPFSPLRWSQGTASWVGVGAPELSGTYVQFAGQGEVYRGEGRELRHVTTFDALLRSNGGQVPAIEGLPAAYKAYYTIGAPIT